MKFEELMFENQDMSKLEIFRSIGTSSPGEYALNHFAEKHNLSYHQVNRVISEIDKDIIENTETWEPFMIGNGKILIRQIPIKLDKYRYILWKKTVIYKFILQAFLEEKMSVEEFCERNKVARSTLYRKLSPLITYLKSQGIKINYNPIDFVGDENMVRIIFSHIFWIGNRGLETPKFADIDRANSLLARHPTMGRSEENYAGKKNLLMSLYVAIARLKRGNFAENNQGLTKIFRDNPLYESKVLINWDIIPEGRKSGEIESFFFYVFMLYSYTDVRDRSIGRILETFAKREKDHPVSKLVQRYLQHFESEVMALSTDQLKLVTANLLSIAFSYYVFGFSIPDLENLTSPIDVHNEINRMYLEKNKDFFESVLKSPEYEELSGTKNELIRKFSALSTPYFTELNSKQKLKVGIALINLPTLINNLKTLLNRLNFVEYEMLDTNKLENYDVVLHSSSKISEEFPSLKATYLWEIDYGEHEYYWLFTELHRHYISKITGH
ncbi:MAG: helix-turn-helix domain-containing protein [Streptococcaceae bacterium]|jgi:hypothetical protein|nr:helix-turn-helix domain-containing protein [Streptococcaceae bacterium]